MEEKSVRVVSNGTIVENTVISEKADLGARGRGKSFMNVINVDKKEEGPRTVPWGTPERTGQGSERAPSTRTAWERPCRKDADQLKRLPRMP